MNKITSLSALVYLACIVIILGGIIYSQQIVIQFLMAIFIAIVASRPVKFLNSKGVPSSLSVVIVLLFIVLLGSFIGGIMGSSVARFTANLDNYDKMVSGGIASVFDFLESFGIHISFESVSKMIDASMVMNFTSQFLNGLGSLMGNMAMILLIVAFMLGELSSFDVKIRAIVDSPTDSFSDIVSQINHYLGIKTITSLATGFIIGISLWFMGVDFPFMWGLIAFLMNYIPNIGSIIAAVPAMFMAYVNLGFTGLMWTGVLFLCVNIIIGSVIEPRVMGKGLGISTLVVLLSLIFWGWILGTIGMFLSIPLTLVVKIACESQDSTRWFAVLLGTEDDAKIVLETKNKSNNEI